MSPDQPLAGTLTATVDYPPQRTTVTDGRNRSEDRLKVLEVVRKHLANTPRLRFSRYYCLCGRE